MLRFMIHLNQDQRESVHFQSYFESISDPSSDCNGKNAIKLANYKQVAVTMVTEIHECSLISQPAKKVTKLATTKNVAGKEKNYKSLEKNQLDSLVALMPTLSNRFSLLMSSYSRNQS